MGRIYVADGSVQQQIDALINRNESIIGLIIGQMQYASAKDLIVRLVPTPACETGEDPASKKCLSIDSVDDHYVANHARQALRMLTGGFDVIGVFACIQPDESKNVQAKLRQVLYAVHKTLSKIDNLTGSYAHSDRLQLQICRLSKKLTCRIFDVADNKSAGNTCELKFQKVIDVFHLLQTRFSLDLTIPVSSDLMSSGLQKQIVAGLQPVFQNISNAVATINGRILPDTDSLCQQTVSKTKGRRQRTNEAGDDSFTSDVFNVDLLQQCSSGGDVPAPSVVSCGAKMTVRGAVASKAYAVGKATVGDAVQMLKKDIVRSIVARCELLCEDLLQAEEEQDVKILYETPLRVFTKLPEHDPVEFCDYLFPDETVTDSAQRFGELLGFEVSSEDIDTEMEHMPSESELQKPVKPYSMDRRRSVSGPPRSTVSQQARKYIGIASAVVLASLAAVASYWFGVIPDQV